MGAGSVVFEVMHCAFISFVALHIVASSLAAKGGGVLHLPHDRQYIIV